VRVCLVSQEYPPGHVGGIGTQSRVKALGLAARGHDVTVLTSGDGSEPALLLRDDGGVAVYELCSPGDHFAVYRTETFWLGYSWAVLGALRELERASPFEVIDFPDYAAEGFAYQLDRPDEDPAAVVVHLHGSLSMFAEQIGWPEPQDPLYRVGTFMEDRSIESADMLIAASRSIAELAASRYAIPLERIEVVEGAVDTEHFCPSPRGSRSDGGLTLLFVGDVEASKGVQAVLDAFLALAEGHPGLSLVIAGAAAQGTIAAMSAQARAAGAAERVSFRGFVEHDELPQLYRSADLFAAPSDYEGGLGMVYLEAMACGLPVIALAAGGAAEAVEHGVTGILLERGGVEETRAAIEQLVTDAPMRASMGEAGRRRVCERFALERYATRVASAYEHALERRRSTVVTW
jgi:glycosyltransferase involved in cell wall biosynthesis